MPSREKLVVIGGVAAGMSAASSAKRAKPEMKVVVLERDLHISYGACSLPYYISDDVKDFHDLIVLTPQAAEKERGIKVLTRHEALSIDKESKQILVKDLNGNKEVEISYDKLVLATGGLPVVPPSQGSI